MKRTALLTIAFYFLFSWSILAPPPGKLQLAWNPVSTMVSGIPIPPTTLKTYRVFRATQANGPWTLIATTTNTNYLDTGLQPNHSWYYYVTVVVNSNESAKSATVAGQT